MFSGLKSYDRVYWRRWHRENTRDQALRIEERVLQAHERLTERMDREAEHLVDRADRFERKVELGEVETKTTVEDLVHKISKIPKHIPPQNVEAWPVNTVVQEPHAAQVEAEKQMNHKFHQPWYHHRSVYPDRLMACEFRE
ncbi:MAG: hypothetical protein Aurels2KO_58100 [Aureliella sp.]